MFTVQERGKAQTLASFGPVFGPVIGSVMGGFIVHRTTDWRWLLGLLPLPLKPSLSSAFSP
jgi:MFS family permease